MPHNYSDDNQDTTSVFAVNIGCEKSDLNPPIDRRVIDHRLRSGDAPLTI
jgi:hypothetical protein